ncbi:MAG: cytochrome ubiquinol oxidase subunit I, partial [Bacteroidales bacterium]|nr:cytochrome ubiquinol oxidase subunit I [Bacteroidales bacterium]
KIELPKLLSIMGYRQLNAFVPGIKDIIEGGYTLQDGTTALSFEEKKKRGEKAIEALASYQIAKDEGRDDELAGFESTLQENFDYFGYGYLDSPEQSIPNVPLLFYTFRVMVAIGFYYILLFGIVWYFDRKKTLFDNKWILHVALWSLPLAYLAGQAGWIVSEVGRQPWAIQDILPVQAAISSLEVSSVITTFSLFLIMFTLLLIAEVRIMVKQIKKGPEEKDEDNKPVY